MKPQIIATFPIGKHVDAGVFDPESATRFCFYGQRSRRVFERGRLFRGKSK